ncbi:MAG: NCS2 family permease [Cyclobacteriaceae bacterium]|nr:NCS2 family permease [Cyclobacteriaceae bacterium]
MFLNDLFKLIENGTSAWKELIAGTTTWVTMVYIVAVNPAMLSNAGMDQGALFVATCLAAAFGSLIMGLYANLPIALAPGMGLNAFFVYSIVKGHGLPWQDALGAVFWSGVLFLILSFSPIRKRIVQEIPESLKSGIAIGIGLFLAVIGLQNAGIIKSGGTATLTQLGNINELPVLFTAIGFVATTALYAKGKNWAVIAGIFLVAVLGWVYDPAVTTPKTFIQFPPSVEPLFGAMNIFALNWDVSFITIVLSLLFASLFDASGTLIAVAKKGNLLDSSRKIINIDKALQADSLGTIFGALIGTSTNISYIESNAGIAVGGRTGLTAVFVAGLFFLTLFFSPLVLSLPSYSTAPALVFVAILLISTLQHFRDWDDFSECVPLVITLIMMPLTFSIADGLAAGYLVYVLVKLFSGRYREVSTVSFGLAVIFIFRFIWLH